MNAGPSRGLVSLFFLAFVVAASIGAPAPLHADGAALTFEDVTERFGVDFSGPHSKEKRFILESTSGGVALVDVDGDGWLDLFLLDSLTVETATKPSRSRLYRNVGGTRFEDKTAEAGLPALGWGVGVCAGDADGDGHVDLYVTGVERNFLLRGAGDFRFEDVTEKAGVRGGGWSTGCGFADADRDGDLDLYVARYLDLDLEDLPAFGVGEICRYRGVPVQCGPRGLPGKDDLYFRNDGFGKEKSGRFVEASKAAGLVDSGRHFGLGVSWLDADLDGWPDLFVANDTGPNYLFRNLGDGRFEESGHLWGVAVTEAGQEQGSMGVAIGDYRNDGWPGLFVTNFSEEYNALYRNHGGEYFTDESVRSGLSVENLPYVGWGTAFLDLDNDGWLDLVWTNGHVYPQMDALDLEASAPYRQRAMLYRNVRGAFAPVSGGPLDAERVGRGLAAGDLDGDGRLDLVITDLDATTRILRNTTPRAGHWLLVELRGRDGHAIGAHLRLEAGPLKLTRQVRSGASYLSQHDFRQHFGLGDVTKVEKLVVRWPDGSTSTHGPFEADRRVTVAQPEPDSARADPKSQDPESQNSESAPDNSPDDHAPDDSLDDHAPESQLP